MNEAPITSEPNRNDDTSFGRYRILRTLAFGGMAQILLARERSGRLVVLKRILPHYAQNKEFVQFFIHEGRLGQRLRHENLVETLEAGQVGETSYIALEYLRGQPAIELLRAASRAGVELPLGVAVRIVADAARGLHHAHTAVSADGQPLHVVHRDVTPHNLFVCGSGITKVLDFGIAKAASQLHHTRAGTIKGKFAYLAPEQVKGEGIDHRVDVFALGIVLHELLTLKPLFRGANDGETLQRVLSMDVPAPERVRRGVPAGLGAVALRALQRDRDRRLPSAEALADSIEAVALAEGIDTSRDAVARLVQRLFPDPEELGEIDEDRDTEIHGDPYAGETAPAAFEGARDDEPVPIEINGEAPTVPSPVPIQRPALPVASTRTHAIMRERTGWVAAVVLLAACGVAAALAWERLGPRRAAPAPRSPEAARAALPRERPSEIAAPTLAPASAPRPQAAPRAAAEATLRVQTDGPATFLVDGRPERTAADGALHLAPGRHVVAVSSPLLVQPRTFTLELQPGEAAVQKVHAGRGTLRVAVTPWAEVTIDGRVLGTTPLQPADLGEGGHWVTLRNSDLGVVTKRRVVVSPGRETVLKVDLFGERK